MQYVITVEEVFSTGYNAFHEFKFTECWDAIECFNRKVREVHFKEFNKYFNFARVKFSIIVLDDIREKMNYVRNEDGEWLS